MADSSVSIAQHYHERTKYRADALQGADIDWDKQPVAFKEYKIGTAFDLKPYLTEQSTAVEDQSWQRLSRLLFCSYGLTVRMTTRMSGEMIYLRASPSAGGLYPAEVYLISRGTPLLAAGLYNYQAQSHSLLRVWDSEIWADLQNACFWHPTLDETQMAIVITAVFYRSSWRYQDRAYRRIFLDTGHLLGNLELASAINDYRPHLIGGFMDEAVNRLLYLDPQQEGAIAVLSLADRLDVRQNLPLAPTALPSHVKTEYPNLPDGNLLLYLHQSTQIPETQDAPSLKILVEKQATQVAIPTQADKYNFPFCLKVSMDKADPILWGDNLVDLETTILKRRSTRALNGANLALEELKSLLDFTYQPQNYIDQTLDPTPDYFDLNLIETFIAVSGVDDLEEGCYYYAPRMQELRQIRFKNFRRELHRLCLGQNLGRDAAVVLFHTADLGKAVMQYGDRVYRYLHMDAGHLGQKLNLAAIRLGLGVSGIAGFFDDEVNEVLGIPTDEAVLYITTLGRPR
jgi:SagB-type dehydrogenase family enzyme